MKRYLLLLLAMLFAFSACVQKWESSQELSVYSTRINLDDLYEKDFTVTVFSNQDWTVSVTQGASWLSVQETGGSSLGFVHVHADASMESSVRVGTLTLRAASGKQTVVYIVQSGENEKASELPDELL